MAWHDVLMRLVTHRPFPTHPHLETITLEWSRSERETLVRTLRILVRARELVGSETDDGMDLGKAEVVLRDWLAE